MRRIIVGVVVLVAAFVAVFILRRGSSLPTSAMLAYQFKAGTSATYDLTLAVTNTVSSGATNSTSHTLVTLATHAKVVRVDSAGAADLAIAIDQPTVTVDGALVPSPLKVTTADLRLFPDGHMESIHYSGDSRAVTILSPPGKGGTAQQVGTATAQGGTDPLESVLLLTQGSLPAMPGGTIKVGDSWSHDSLINAPYMLLEQALSHSKLDGFQRESDVDLARIITDAAAPIDLQTYQARGSPQHLKGSESLHVLSFFSPGLGALVRTAGNGHVDVTQTVSSGSSTSKVGSLSVSTPPVRTTTDISFTAKLRQS
jgi:hypothetical protein